MASLTRQYFGLTESILTKSIVQIFELLSFHEGLLIKQFASKVKVIFSYPVVAIFLLRITLQAIVDRRRLLPNLNLKGNSQQALRPGG